MTAADNVLELLTQGLPEAPLDHDLCVMLGDFNFRLEAVGRDEVLAALRAGRKSALLEDHDELRISESSGDFSSALAQFNEGQVEFSPTYKYDNGTSTFDSSKKQRVPAWTDRVLWASTDTGSVGLALYTAVPDIVASDHKPIAALLRWRPGWRNAKRGSSSRWSVG
eukprot:6297335-Prymnesium_polylepis.1